MDASIDIVRRIVPATETYFSLPSGYQGPGDIVSALAWGGLRAYRAATAGSKCVNIIRASDSTAQDFNTLANGSLDVASIATFLNATTGKIVTLYDQTGNGFDLTQTNDLVRPDYISNPGISFLAATSQFLEAVNVMTQSQPFTLVFVAERTGNFAATNTVMANSAPTQIGFEGGTPKIFLYAGNALPDAPAADSAFHAVQGIFNGAASSITVDGVTTSGLDLISATGISFAPSIGTQNALTGVVNEVGWFAGGLSAGQLGSLNVNMRTFWGF